jgi:predicted ATPase/DNA-binding SARP family transcriptional activator
MVAAPTRINSNGAGALPQVELYLLGTPRIVVDGAPRRLPYQKATALLAYLVVTARPHSREALATLLWDSADERRAQNSLRNALYVVRRDLKPAAPLAVTHRQVSVEGTGLWLDVDCFKRSVRGKEETVASLANALALWRGPFLDGLSVEGAADFNTWVSSTREQLSRFHQDGWLALSRAYEKIEQWHQALDAALQVLTLDPLYEAGHRQVMRLHLRMGNRAAALQQYEKCRNLLIEELGVVPDARTRSLHEQALAERPLFKRGRSPVLQAERQSVFIGRRQELAALDEHLRTVVREARGRLVLVEGEAGIGKTRLVNEWLGSLHHVHVLSGRCFEAEQGIPYHPWIDLLRNSLQHRDWQRLKLSDLWRAELSQLIPELRTMYPDLPFPAALDPELARGRLAEAVHQWLRILGQQKAVCLFLDDLQWIDRASLALLEYLLRHSVALSLMIVGTQRERETDPHWQRTESRLAREGACHRMSLFRLSFSEVAAIAYHFGFRAADPDAFLTRLFRETEGNSLFVVEILRSLQTMDVDPSGPWSIPPTVKGVVQSHLNRLSTRTRQMLTVAAVIGRTFNHTTLKAVTGQPLELVLSVLDEGIAAGLIVEQDGRYDFSHDKIRAVLYNAVSRARRQHLHRRFAEALESLYAGDLSPFFGLLAQHLEAAGEAHLARRYALQAAKRAVELYADEDALSWYDRAQALSEIVPTELDPGSIPQVIPFHQLYISSASPLDVPGLVYRQQGLIHQRRGRYEMARQNFELALTRAIKRQRLDEQAAAHGLLSYLAYLRGDYDELTQQAQRSLELATRTGKVALQAEGLRNLGIAAYRTGDYQRAIELYRQSLSASRSINDRAGMAKCHNNIGFALRTLQQFDASVASYQRALELHEATGSIEGAALVLANIGGVYAHSGNLEQALVYLERAFTLSDESHADWITARVCRTMGGVYLRNDQRHQALSAAERARNLAQTLGSKEDLGAAYRLLGEITAAWPESGLGAADDYFDKSVSLLRQVGEQYELTRALSSLEAYRQTRG